MSRQIQAGRPFLGGLTAAAFLLLGLSNGMMGPVIPALAKRWQVPLDQAGAMFTVLFLTSCLTIAVGSFLLDRIGRKPMLVSGMLGLGLGAALIAVSPNLGLGLFGAFVVGLGFGCLEGTVNVFVADLFPASRNQALNIMNGIFGIGALIAPLAVGFSISASGQPNWALLIAALVNTIAGLLFVVVAFPAYRHEDAEESYSWRSVAAVLRDRYVVLVALMMFFYVGIEVSFGGWVFSFGRQGAGLDESAAAVATTVFWTAFTLSRMAAGLISRWVSGVRVVLGGATLAAVGAILIALAGSNPPLFFLATIIVGVGLAPIFPTTFGLVSDRYPQGGSGARSSVIVLGGSLGGSVAPFLLGFVLVNQGVPATASCIAVIALIVIVMQLGLRSGLNRRRTPVAAPTESPARAKI